MPDLADLVTGCFQEILAFLSRRPLHETPLAPGIRGNAVGSVESETCRAVLIFVE